MNRRIALGIIAALVIGALLLLERPQPNPTPAAEPDSAPAPAAGPPSAKPRLPAPRVQLNSTPDEPEPAPSATNLLARLLHNEKSIQLTREQVEPYLTANRRNAASLLAAFRTTGDTNLLREAMEKFPQDPMVDFAAVFKKGASPEERRQWLDTFKQSAPDNALANFLSARDYFKAGQNDRAVEELQAASGKSSFEDYSLLFMQNSEEAYRSTGYSDAEAKALAATQLLLPHLVELKQTGLNAIDLAKFYRQAGDESSAQAVLQSALNLGGRLQKPDSFNPLINELVGIAIERTVLQTMNPNDPYGSRTVQDRLNETTSYRDGVKSLVKQTWPIIETLPESEVITFFDRERYFGEFSALKWVLNKYGPQSP